MTQAKTVSIQIAGDGPLPAKRILRTRKTLDLPAGPVVLVTDRDLALPGCDSLFGYANPKRQIAIVSTRRLASDGRAGRLNSRLRNVIAHEGGHLDGYRHCDTPGCLMQAAREPADIDRRGSVPCGRCPRQRPGVLAFAGVLGAFVAATFALGLLNPLLAGRPMRPFSVQTTQVAGADALAAKLLFRGEPVLLLRTSGRFESVGTRADALSARLNRLFNEVPHQRFEIATEPSDGVALLADGQRLLEVLPADAAGEDRHAVASRWQAQFEQLVWGKGWAHENCPTCHIARIAEVRAAARLEARVHP